jgi:ribosomal protein L21E
MATQEQLEVDSLTKELTALKLAAQGRSAPDAKINKRIAAVQDLLERKKTATLSTPNATYKKGGMVKKNKPAVKKMAQGGAAMSKKQTAKVGKVMKEFKEGTLHSGKNGKVVKDKGQAIAIALAQARKAKK